MPRLLKDSQEVILSARMGSYAYGLDHAGSDVDHSGVYVEAPEAFMGLGFPADKKLTVDNTTDDYDYCYHEIRKYCGLAAGCNPSALEVMFSEEFITMTPAGQLLVDNRHAFLSGRARATFAGYARGQADLLERRQGDFGSDMKKRYSKNARHLYRLFREGRELLETGELRLKLTAQERVETFAVGEMPWQDLAKLFKDLDDQFKEVVSVLPEEPDQEFINQLVMEIRTMRTKPSRYRFSVSL